MTIDELTVNFSHINPKDIISDWVWLVGKRRIPVLITATGDTFLQDTSSNEIFFLDVGFGELEKVASDPDEFREKLSDREFVFSYFPVPVIAHMQSVGNILKHENVYSYKILPSLGGARKIENLQQCSLVVHISMSGQIHHQLKDVPPGTKIKSLKLQVPEKKPWWKLW